MLHISGMPTENARKLTDEQKAEIVLLKDTRPTGSSTNKNIAGDFQVSVDLVNRMNYERLTDEQKAIYDRKQKDLKYHCQDLTFQSIIRAKEMLRLPKTKLSEVMGAAKIGNDIYRLETNQATSINENRDDPQSKLLEFARLIVESEQLNLSRTEDREALRDAIERCKLGGDRGKVLELVERGEI